MQSRKLKIRINKALPLSHATQCTVHHTSGSNKSFSLQEIYPSEQCPNLDSEIAIQFCRINVSARQKATADKRDTYRRCAFRSPLDAFFAPVELLYTTSDFFNSIEWIAQRVPSNRGSYRSPKLKHTLSSRFASVSLGAFIYETPTKSLNFLVDRYRVKR